MSYTKTIWATNDIITAAKLNNLEDGIAQLKFTYFNLLVDNNTPTLDGNYEQIKAQYDTFGFAKCLYDATASGGPAIIANLIPSYENNLYQVIYSVGNNSAQFTSETSTGTLISNSPTIEDDPNPMPIN